MSPEQAPAPGDEAPAAPPRAGVPLQTRGAVQPGAMYVARAVDQAVVAALSAGQWTVILGPRFSGKSSLRARTARALQSPPPAEPLPDAPVAPLRCATLELRQVAQQAASSGAAYLLMCSMLATQLRLPAVSAFWQRHGEAPPAARFQRFLLDEVAGQAARTVILIDDLEALALPPLAAAEVLDALQKVQEALAAAGMSAALAVAAFSALPLSRLGAAGGAGWAAGALLLPDFTRRELDAFAPALAALCQDGESTAADWLDAVFAWTSGHPQLTQHLCQQLVARAPAPGPAAPPSGAPPSERVEHLVRTLYPDDGEARDDALQHDPCGRAMVEALTGSPNAQALLALYRRLLSGMPVTPDPLDEVQRELRLCGLCTEAADPAGALRLRPRCRLLAELLGEDWAREQEVRLVLAEAIDRESAARAPTSGGPLLRGSALKTAQAWARKHPAALRPAEIRVLLASLEAARSEVEAKHQSSAAALQRELRDKTEGRLSLSPSPRTSLGAKGAGPTSAPPEAAGSARPRRTAALTIAVSGLVLCVSLAALAGAYRRMARLEQASRDAAARAQRAEQALQALQSSRSQPAGALAPLAEANDAPIRPASPVRAAARERDPRPDPGRPAD